VSDNNAVKMGTFIGHDTSVPKVSGDSYVAFEKTDDVHADHVARQMGRPIDWNDVRNDMEDLDTYFQKVFKNEYERIYGFGVTPDTYEDIRLAREMFIKGILATNNHWNPNEMLEFIRAGR